MSFESDFISSSVHSTWFSKSMDDPLKSIYIGENEGQKIGVCRFDLDKSNVFSEVSINMNPVFRGRGLASKFLRAAVRAYLEKNNVALVARIRETNIASIKIFDAAGFLQIKQEEDKLVFQLPRNAS